MKFKSNIGVQAGIEDNNDFAGDPGQILSSTGVSGVAWIDQSAVTSSSDFVFFNVKNETGSTILKGKGVMAVGTDGNSGHILVDEMVADGTVESKYFLGVLEEDIANGGFARVISFGQLDQFDTRGQNGETWADGQVLWCDPANNGDFTITEPDGPNVKIAAAFILNKATNGKIQVRVQANEGIHDLHDTKITSQVDGDVLVWDNTTGVWFNDSTLNVDYTAGNVGIGTTSPLAKTHIKASNANGDSAASGTLIVEQGSSPSIQLLSANSQTQTIKFADPQSSQIGRISYSHPNDAMFFVTNGGERMRITSSGNVGIGTTSPGAKLDVNGIVNIDGTLFVNTTNNHIRLVDTDNTGNFSVGVNTNFQIRDITANTTPLTIRAGTPSDTILTTASGRVGIGLSSPGTTLHVDGFARLNGGLQMNATNATIYQILDSALRFGTNNTERMRISSTGNVGIGTTDPQAKLHINRTTLGEYFRGGSGGLRELRFSTYNTASDHAGHKIDASSGNGEITLATGGSARLTVDNTGNVGIGTTDPTHQLQVHNPTGDGAQVNFTDSSTTALDGNGFRVGWNGSVAQMYLFEDADMRFGTNNAERMRITSGGNVGIGTTDVTNAKLKVAGGGVDVESSTNSLRLRFYEGATFKSGIQQVLNVGEMISGSAIGDMAIRATAGNMLFATGGNTERMRIDSSGNVGIGTDDPDYPLHISSTLGYPVLIERTNSRDAGIRFKDSFTTSADSVRIGADGDDFKILTSNSERFRINESGNVQLNSYGSGTITGTTAYNLAVDSSGNIIENSANTRSIFVATSTDTTTNINATTTIQWNSENIKDSGYTHSDTTNPEQIAITQTGTYKIYAAITYNTTVQRANVAVEILVNDVATGTRGAGGYVRSASSHNDGTTIVEDYITVSANDVIKIQTSQEAESGTVNLRSGESKIIIEKLTGLTLSTTDANTLGGLGAADFVAVTGDTMTGALSINEGGATIKKTNSLSKQTVLTVQELADEGSQQTLVLKNTNNRDVGIKFETAGGINYIWQDSGDGIDDALIFSTGGENRTNDAALILHQNQEVIIPNGNVGIGTISPATALDVNGSIRVTGRTSPSSGNGLEFFYYSPADTFYLEAYDYTNSLYKNIRYAGLSHQFINGNVGIGTTSPTSKIHVIGQDATFYSNQGDQSMQIGRNANERLELYVNDSIAKITAIQDSDNDGPHDFILNRIFAGAGSNDFIVQKDGSAQLTINTDGNVGIGVTSPGAKLDVYTNTSAAYAGRFTQDHALGYGVLIDVDSTSVNQPALWVKNAATTSIWAGSNGKVGIGTTGPSYQLTLGGNAVGSTEGLRINDPSNASYGAHFSFSDTPNEVWIGGITNNTYNSAIGIHREATRSVTIDVNNNVGIGTTDPGAKLDVNGYVKIDSYSAGTTVAHDAGYLKIESQGKTGWGPGDEMGKIEFYVDDGSGVGRRNAASIRAVNNQGNGTSTTTFEGELAFYTSLYNTAESESMRIDSSGNVGIGTTSPSFGTGGGLQITNAAQANLRFTDTSDSTFITDLALSNDDFYIINRAASGQLKFRVNASNEAMTIDSNGNVGIGTTSPDSKLQVDGGIQMANDTDAASANKVGTMRYRTGTEYVEVTGIELITNGDFTTDTDWGKNSGVTISGGTMNFTSTSGSYGSQNINFTNGVKYKINFEITAETSGILTVFLGAGNNVGSISGVGKKEIIATGNSSLDTKIYFGNNFTGSIDNVSIVEVTEENASYADMCMQTGASTYEWVNIVRNTY